MRKILFIILLFFIGFNQAQVKQSKKLTGKKEWINPVKLTKEEKARPYMSEVLKTRDSLTPSEAERRRKNIEAGNPFKKYGYYPKVATLSKGKYLEFHDQDSIVIIGSVKYNVKKDSISGLMEINLDDPDAQPIGDTHGRWISPDPLSEEFSSWSPYNYALNNPLRNADPTGMAPEDWVKDGNRIFFDPSVTGNSQVQAKYGSNAQSIEGYHVTKNGITTSYALGQDGSINTNFANIVSTTTSVYDTGNIETGAATIEGQLGLSNGAYIRETPSLNTQEGAFANPSAQLASTMLTAMQEAPLAILSEVAVVKVGSYLNKAKNGVDVVEQTAVHGNSLNSTRPTWGYKLYSEDGTFLKNGITSQAKAESRYTKSFMADKYMEKQLFPNRRAAYNWEAAENKILKGPLNKNNH